MTTALIEIREERPDDLAAIRDVNKRAFGQDQEGNIVEALRSNGAALLSLVATLDGEVVGHIMYSPITVGQMTGVVLGPMAVLPEHQREGIGSKLVEAGNRKLKEAGYPFIIVLGHPNFYPRLASRPPACTDPVRMERTRRRVYVIDSGPGENARRFALAKYRPEFSTVT